MQQVYISMGSNIDDPLRQLQSALNALKEIEQSKVIQQSSFYQSPPLDSIPQPDFSNVVVEMETQLEPEDLLNALQAIENKQGRVRTPLRWGSRCIDLDILLYGLHVINTDRLTIPHYDMKRRDFVLYPLHEIAPDLVFPNGERLVDLLSQCPQQRLKKVHYET